MKFMSWDKTVWVAICLVFLFVFVGCKKQTTSTLLGPTASTTQIKSSASYLDDNFFNVASKHKINVRLTDPRTPGVPQWFSGSYCGSPWPLVKNVKSISLTMSAANSKYSCQYRFDELGRLIEFIDYDGSPVRIEFSYSGNAEQPHSEKCNKGILCNRKFEYNQNGNLIKETNLNEEGSIYAVLKYDYRFITLPDRIMVTVYEDKNDGRGEHVVKQDFFDPITGRLIAAIYSFSAFSLENNRLTKKPLGMEIKYLERGSYVLAKIDQIDLDDPENTSLFRPMQELMFNKSGLIVSDKNFSYIGSPSADETIFSYKQDYYGNWIERITKKEKAIRKISYYK